MPLTKDLIDDPSLWQLSLLIGAGGIDIFAHRSAGEDGGVVVESLRYDPAAQSAAEAVEEAVYSNPLLLQPFQKVHLVLSTPRAIVVPSDTDMESLETLLAMEHDDVMLESPVDDRHKVVYVVERGVANFLQRTYDRAVPVHALAVLARYSAARSRRGNVSRMLVSLGTDGADIVVFNQLGLAAARHVSVTTPRETAYYVLAIFKHCGMNARHDEIVIAGNTERRVALIPQLSRFVNSVMPAIFPAGRYSGASQAVKASYPLVVLPLCE